MALLNQTSQLIQRWQANDELKVAKTPLGVSGILLGLLKDHFSYNSQQFKYVSNPIESKILLDLHQQWKPENCENYPGVYVRRQNWIPRAETKVIGDHKDFTLPDGMSIEYWVPITTNYSFICVGKEYGEIEILLSEVGTYFLVFWEVIANALGFQRMDVVGISPVGILQENKNYRTGQVDLSLLFDFPWKITLEKPILRKVRPEVEGMV